MSSEISRGDDVRERIKNRIRNVSLFDLAKNVAYAPTQIKRLAVGTDRKLRREYLASRSGDKKLQLGSGMNLLDGWLNSDYCPKATTVLHLDATRKFPFADEEFHYVFSEHVIEHVSYLRGCRMLSECFRVLKPNGKLRLATPDLRSLLDLYEHRRSEVQNDYLEWAVLKNTLPAPPGEEDTFVINNFVRDWGHTFIYDEKVLRRSMEQVGFRDIRKFAVSLSDDEQLRGLEYEDRMPAGFLDLETIVLEGTK